MLFKQFFSFTSVFWALVLVFYPANGKAETLSVLGENIFLRDSPNKKAATLWEYGNGFPLEVLKKKGEWVQVKDFENDTGWIHQTKLQKTPHTIVKANKGSEKVINIRSGPGTNTTTIGTAHYGVVFSILDKKDSWIQIRHESGLTGWVKRDLLWGL